MGMIVGVNLNGVVGMNMIIYSEIGWKNMFPMYCNMKINETEAWPYQVNKYQRKDLKKLFD